MLREDSASKGEKREKHGAKERRRTSSAEVATVANNVRAASASDGAIGIDIDGALGGRIHIECALSIARM